MRIVSFDVFDTVLTRLHAHPFDLFHELAVVLIERRLFSGTHEDFINLRVEAESTARLAHDHREVSLAEIYEQIRQKLGWTSDTALEVQQLEIQLEQRFLKPVPGARRLLAEARENSDAILFISDMYLSSSVIREVLVRENLWGEGDRIYLSSEHRKSKAHGTLYHHIRSEFNPIQSWTHHGDNRAADIAAAKRCQISPIHFCECELNRYEEVFRPRSENFVPLIASKFAGCMRLARLQCPVDADPVLWRTGVDVVGPILFSFVDWCLRNAIKRKLSRLYFLSREGEILVQIAQILCEAWKLPIECRYLYGSRQAWRFPAITALGSEEREWVVAPHQLMNVRACLARVGLRPENFEKGLAHHNFPPDRWTRNLSLAEREELWKFIQTPAVRSSIFSEIDHARKNAIAYLKQEGLEGGSEYAIVDIGWYGNLQKALHKLLAQEQGANAGLHGLYFALLTTHPLQGDTMEGFWNTIQSDQDCLTLSTAFWEAFTAASHGSVLGYVRNRDRLDPVLEYEVNQPALEWGLKTLQQSICEFARTISEHVPFESYEFATVATGLKRLYDLFYFEPDRAEALKWGAFPFKSQSNELIQDQFVPAWGEWKILDALLHYEKRPTSWWMEGTLARGFSPSLALFLKMKAWKKRMQRSVLGKFR